MSKDKREVPQTPQTEKLPKWIHPIGDKIKGQVPRMETPPPPPPKKG